MNKAEQQLPEVPSQKKVIKVKMICPNCRKQREIEGPRKWIEKGARITCPRFGGGCGAELFIEPLPGYPGWVEAHIFQEGKHPDN